MERAYAQRPFTDAVALRSAFHDALLSGTGAEQLALMNSFADLGTEDNGTYTGDHNAAGLGALDEELRGGARALRDLPCAIRVPTDHLCPRRGSALRAGACHWLARLANAPSVERATGLIEIAKIANYRFDDLVANANPIASARVARFEQLKR